MADGDGRALRRRPAAVRDRHRLPAAQGAHGRRRRHADEQPRLRAGARRASAFRSARAKVGDRYVLEQLHEQRLACSAARTPVTSSASTSTRRATASSRRSPVLRALLEQKTHARRRLTADVTMFPQMLINVPVQRGFDWHAQRRRHARRARGRASLGDGPRAAASFGNRARAARDGRGARRDLAETHAQSLAETIARAAGMPL